MSDDDITPQIADSTRAFVGHTLTIRPPPSTAAAQVTQKRKIRQDVGVQARQAYGDWPEISRGVAGIVPTARQRKMSTNGLKQNLLHYNSQVQKQQQEYRSLCCPVLCSNK